MRRIREVLRLKWGCGLGNRAVAEICGLSRSTVSKYVRRAKEADLAWPLPEHRTDEELERRVILVPQAGPHEAPNWPEVHRQLTRKGVTLQLLWEEYKQRHPDGLQYTQFCVRYRTWRQTLDLPMRQDHKAGEKLFVDCCGQTVPITNRATGEHRTAQILVAPQRHRTFSSLSELNDASARLPRQHNEHPFQKLNGSRRTHFEALDKPALKPLPSGPVETEKYSRLIMGYRDLWLLKAYLAGTEAVDTNEQAA